MLPTPPTTQAAAPQEMQAGQPPMQGGAGGEMSPEQAQQLILEALSQLKQVASQYGLDLQSLLAQV